MISPRTRQNLKSEFQQSLMAKVGSVILLVVVFATVFAPILVTHDPTAQNLDNAHAAPFASFQHPLGTDALGRDMLSRTIYGTRTSMIVGILGVGIAAAIGVPWGLAAGYYGGHIDDVLMRIGDVMLAFPAIVLAIALIGLWGRAAVPVPDPIVMVGLAPNAPETFVIPGTVILVVGLVNSVWFARVARGEAMSVADEEYVTAAESTGAADRFVIRKHVLPNSSTPILVLGTILVAAIILLESALSFLGFSGTTLSWGYDIAQGRDYLATSWWISTIPGIAILLAVISVNLVGDWFRDALDPGIEGEGGGI